MRPSLHSTVVWHAGLQEISCLKITVKLSREAMLQKEARRSAQHLFLSLSHLSFCLFLFFCPRRYEPWKSHLFSWRGMIRSAQRMHGFTHLCVPARPPRTAWRERVNAGKTSLVTFVRSYVENVILNETITAIPWQGAQHGCLGNECDCYYFNIYSLKWNQRSPQAVISIIIVGQTMKFRWTKSVMIMVFNQ